LILQDRMQGLTVQIVIYPNYHLHYYVVMKFQKYKVIQVTLKVVPENTEENIDLEKEKEIEKVEDIEKVVNINFISLLYGSTCPI
jgi:hypothetical protein